MRAEGTVGANVRRLRLERGLTQEALADAAGLDRTYVSGLERGVRNPSLSTLSKLAAALDVPLARLVEDAGAE